jgi:hypothetical protein
MSVALSTIVRQVKRRLLGAAREELTTLQVPLTDTTGTTMTLSSAPSGMATGAAVSIGTEMMYVLTWDPSARVATVIRGYLSDPTTHVVSDVVEVNSRFPTAVILDAIHDQIDQLPLGIFGVYDTGWIPTVSGGMYLVDITGATGLTEDVIYGVLTALIDKPDQSSSWAVAVQNPQQPTRWAQLTGCQPRRVRYPTATDPMKFLIRLTRDGGVQWDASEMSFQLATRPNPSKLAITPTTRLLEDLYLPESLASPLTMRTMIQLWADQEVKRSSRQTLSESRISQDVPAGLIMSDINGMRQMADQLYAEEAAKLRARYPMMWSR